MASELKRVTPEELRAALHDGGEIALLDPREEGVFNERHLLFAACAPLGRLELLLDDMVPRRSVRAVWCDDGEGMAEAAARRMTELGYSDVAILEGGVDAWEAAGFPVYAGVHVPSKAFAEVVEHEAGTPYISAEELKAMIDGGDDIAIFDTRSYEEFHSNSIPTAVSAPGAELVYRFDDLAPSPDTLVVVNCGGRTRSIIGAQALINAGVPNKVVSLKNGTQDWHLADYEIVRGATRRIGDISPEARAAALARAKRFQELAAAPELDAEGLERWKAESGDRALFLIDVRTAEEYERGHAPGVRHVAGGQLVQETDRHVAIWGARVVLFDDDGVRAAVTASWMRQMGWDVAVMKIDAVDGPLETGPYQARPLGLDGVAPKTIDVAALSAAMKEGDVAVVDLGLSKAYRGGHIPGAWFVLRSRLASDLAKVAPSGRLVFTSKDGALARLAAAEHQGIAGEVLALEGGTDAWVAAGLPLETDDDRKASPAIDLRLAAREQEGDVKSAMRAYLAWEIELVNQMADDKDHRFKVSTPA